ncbi:peptidoglycan hydrolase-like protein with peptidoglycan-binding domain [Granulicella aggregans]|uniref:N-acetylmuramoyl-L-alanine amidase n=1 Tax=Granulicella aggregans TaxID=474949 RepID=A0A7W7ZDJ3_9BACT|nr:peptidoglycan-binding domain-containing protein [Granulicella aggregans]MBB5057371.1 peptidoglycan hydrolase-like protein with peptidoglycan-binding domain [Granulicella aggregans]
MPFSLTWLPDVLLDAGLKVAKVDGWEFRGLGDMGDVLGVICHHTAGPLSGNMPSLNTILHGRPDLRGPLAHLGLGRDGTFYIIAAGKCQHAGPGIWRGVTAGNTHFIGIEAENTGLANDQPWPQVQVDAYQHGIAAILRKMNLPADACAGHKEYATPQGRKTDPDFDMAVFRSGIAKILDGSTPAPSPIPASEPPKADGSVPRPTLRRPATGDLVKVLQTKLKLTPDGIFGPGTEAAVRALQRTAGLTPDGIVGPKTWQLVDQSA